MKNLDLIKTGYISKINNNDTVIENQPSQKFNMTLDVQIEECHYRLFDNMGESSHIKFLSINKFPDGIYIKKEKHNYEVSIFELKVSPHCYLDKIPEQFLGALMHVKSFLSMIDENFTMSVTYYIGGYEFNNPKLDYSILTGYRKNTPGEQAVVPAQYKNYKQNNELKFCKGDYFFKCNFKRIQFDLKDEIDGMKFYTSQFKMN